MTLGYTILNGRARLTELDTSGDCLQINITPRESGTVLLAKTVIKIENGVGRVKLSAIKSGTHQMTLTVRGTSLLLGKITLAAGAVALTSAHSMIAEANAREAELEARTDALEKEVSALRDAVYGKKIF